MTFCEKPIGEMERSNTKLLSNGYPINQYSPTLDKCLCTIKANGTVYLKSTVEFMTDPETQESNDTCGPLLKFEYEKVGCSRTSVGRHQTHNIRNPSQFCLFHILHIMFY